MSFPVYVLLIGLIITYSCSPATQGNLRFTSNKTFPLTMAFCPHTGAQSRWVIRLNEEQKFLENTDEKVCPIPE